MSRRPRRSEITGRVPATFLCIQNLAHPVAPGVQGRFGGGAELRVIVTGMERRDACLETLLLVATHVASKDAWARASDEELFRLYMLSHWKHHEALRHVFAGTYDIKVSVRSSFQFRASSHPNRRCSMVIRARLIALTMPGVVVRRVTASCSDPWEHAGKTIRIGVRE